MTRAVALTLLTLGLLSACGPSIEMTLPERFVALTDDPAVNRGRYQYRATTPDGVVVGVMSLEHRVDGSLAFWSEAITRRIRDQQGYALLSEGDVSAARGEAGHIMRFGRDIDGHTYRYTIALFVTPDRIYVVEAGGRDAAYAELEEGIEGALSTLRL